MDTTKQFETFKKELLKFVVMDADIKGFAVYRKFKFVNGIIVMCIS